MAPRTTQQIHPEDVNESFLAIISRLNELSLDDQADAYVDIDWDATDLQIDPTDPRFQVTSLKGLLDNDWYRRLSEDDKSRLGLKYIVDAMRMGMHFENGLQRGLLLHAAWAPNGDPTFRYLHHEIMEESQHSLMFQEFVNRTGQNPLGMPIWIRLVLDNLVVPIAIVFPELFFVFVLGGEEPIDHAQRQQLREPNNHPLVEKIVQIHTHEEARHISFAKHYIDNHVDDIGPVRREIMSVLTPVILGIMTRLMLNPSEGLRRDLDMPRRELRRVKRHPHSRQLLKDSVRRTRKMAADKGFLTPAGKLVWRLVGLWDDDRKPAGRPVQPEAA
ncbi:MAG: diiron oxygenase [Nitriliruptorales bacterium]|nr:diiron oxygenase [Nitriliruptorales bacterium]